MRTTDYEKPSFTLNYLDRNMNITSAFSLEHITPCKHYEKQTSFICEQVIKSRSQLIPPTKGQQSLIILISKLNIHSRLLRIKR